MKFTLIAVFAFCSICTVKAAVDTRDYKRILIRCPKKEDLLSCEKSLKTIVADPPNQDSYSKAQLTFGGLGAVYYGGCPKAEEKLRTLSGCGVKVCREFKCEQVLPRQ